MTWEILSFKGMGPIRFGMTPADVEASSVPRIAAARDSDQGS